MKILLSEKNLLEEDKNLVWFYFKGILMKYLQEVN